MKSICYADGCGVIQDTDTFCGELQYENEFCFVEGHVVCGTINEYTTECLKFCEPFKPEGGGGAGEFSDFELLPNSVLGGYVIPG